MDNSNILYAEYLRVHPQEIYCFSRIEYINDRRRLKESSLRNLSLNYSRSEITEKAERKAKKAIKYMIFGTNYKKAYNPKFKSTYTFKINFITLTLPSKQRHTAVELKNTLLNQFLIEAKKYWKVDNYVWRFESQKNGNAHFHILMDKFIPWIELRNTWNRICNKLGYIDEFEKINKHRSPNSTDIHSIRKINNVIGYVLKYMVKDDKKVNIKVHRKDIDFKYSENYHKNTLSIGVKKFLGTQAGRGRLWTCSKALSNITGGEEEIDRRYQEELNRLSKIRSTKKVVKERFTGYFYEQDVLNDREFPLLFKLLMEYVRQIFPNYQEQLIFNT
jgi:hypothetical protein